MHTLLAPYNSAFIHGSNYPYLDEFPPKGHGVSENVHRRPRSCDLSKEDCSKLSLAKDADLVLIPGTAYSCALIFENGTEINGEMTGNLTCHFTKWTWPRNSTDLIEAIVRINAVESGRNVDAFGIQFFDSKCRFAADPLVLRSNLCVRDRKCYNIGEVGPGDNCEKCGDQGAWESLESVGKLSWTSDI